MSLLQNAFDASDFGSAAAAEQNAQAYFQLLSYLLLLAHAVIDQVVHHRFDVSGGNSAPGRACFREARDSATIAIVMRARRSDMS